MWTYPLNQENNHQFKNMVLCHAGSEMGNECLCPSVAQKQLSYTLRLCTNYLLDLPCEVSLNFGGIFRHVFDPRTAELELNNSLLLIPTLLSTLFPHKKWGIMRIWRATVENEEFKGTLWQVLEGEVYVEELWMVDKSYHNARKDLIWHDQQCTDNMI